MTYKRYKLLRTTALLLLLWPAANVRAVTIAGEILGDDIAPEADTPVLQAEAALLDTLRQGIALSFARCRFDVPCELNVNQNELETILATIDKRINLLATRHNETGEAELEEIIVAYADARDGYSEFLKQIKVLAPSGDDEEEELGDEDIFGFGAARRRLPAEYEVFADVDEALEDDEDVVDEAEESSDPADVTEEATAAPEDAP